ncbi:hypothetical protein ElyMa_005687600 [Elysia marginata]|uniref:Uncharacterized protein n=1 Tax=Elysia marginata TaxID=1093978 RepID=A0AAV4FER2_9GAST|nr:hypothetical protein ElyMa_005687600 [Elysia marginata]
MKGEQCEIKRASLAGDRYVAQYPQNVTPRRRKDSDTQQPGSAREMPGCQEGHLTRGPNLDLTIEQSTSSVVGNLRS